MCMHVCITYLQNYVGGCGTNMGSYELWEVWTLAAFNENVNMSRHDKINQLTKLKFGWLLYIKINTATQKMKIR